MLPLRGWLGRSVLSLAVATPVTLAALVAGIAAASAASASGSAATTASATAGAAATGAAAAAAAAATERAWSPVVVDDVVPLGAQVSPELTNVSRDGGHSVLLNRRIVWLYADTECIGDDGARLSFASNTAAYAAQPRADIAAVRDFGLVAVGRNAFGDAENAVLAPDAVDGGGWVPFGADERRYNELNQGKRRIAIWPGTNPVPLNKTHALLYAPVVHVDSASADPAAMYQQRGVTLISVMAPVDGPKAVRINPLLFREHEIPFGVFAAVVGYVSANTSASGSLKQNSSSSSSSSDNDHADDINNNRYVYLLGVATAGLQLARVPLGQVNDSAAYTYFRPRTGTFGRDAPPLNATNTTDADVYLAGSFSYGTLFHSPYFRTFVLVYMNKLADSTFYIRFLDLRRPRAGPALAAKMDGWLRNGTYEKDERGGFGGSGGGGGGIGGIGPEDVDALARYAWSPAQVLHRTPPGKGGYSYAGAVHPEYFSRRYYPRSPVFTASDIAATAAAAAAAAVVLPSASGSNGNGRAGGGGQGGGSGGVDSGVGSGIERGEWFGGYEVPERDAGGDGRHLLLSWTAQARGGFATGIYQVQLARVAFGDIPAPPPPPPPPSPPTNNITVQANATSSSAGTASASSTIATTSALPTKRPQTILPMSSSSSSSSSSSTYGTPFIFVGRAAAVAGASAQKGMDGTALFGRTLAVLTAAAVVFGYM